MTVERFACIIGRGFALGLCVVGLCVDKALARSFCWQLVGSFPSFVIFLDSMYSSEYRVLVLSPLYWVNIIVWHRP